MLKKVAYWFVVLSPVVILCALLFLFATAAYIIHISRDSEAFTRAVKPLQELAIRVYYSQRSNWHAQSDCLLFDELLLYKPRPGRCEFNNLEFSTVLTFDSRGFRHTSPPMKRDDDRRNRRRVIVVGDSQAMGWGVQDGETFASVLAAEHGFEVYNLGVASYGTARELLRLQREFDLRPNDTVIIQYHPNDLEENLAFLRQGLPKHAPSDLNLQLAYTPRKFEIPEVSMTIARDVWETLRARVRLRERLRRAFTRTESSSSENTTPAQIFLAVVDRFQELVQVKVVVCEVPSYGRGTSFAEDLKRLTDSRISVVTPVWETSDYYRLDDHLNSAGHRKLAQLFAAAISSD